MKIEYFIGVHPYKNGWRNKISLGEGSLGQINLRS